MECGELKLDADTNCSNWIRNNAMICAQGTIDRGRRAAISVENTDAVLETLEYIGLQALHDRIAAMPARFDNVAGGAAGL